MKAHGKHLPSARFSDRWEYTIQYHPTDTMPEAKADI